MSRAGSNWRLGSGALGRLRPLLGKWWHSGPSKLGQTDCTREFTPVLSGKFIQLRAMWRTPKSEYEELALFGSSREKTLTFWSFTSDGGQSEGELAQALDVHSKCLCFEADMPAGRARMLYWPHDDDGFWFAVESRNKRGWTRFLEQHFRAAR